MFIRRDPLSGAALQHSFVPPSFYNPENPRMARRKRKERTKGVTIAIVTHSLASRAQLTTGLGLVNGNKCQVRGSVNNTQMTRVHRFQLANCCVNYTALRALVEIISLRVRYARRAQSEFARDIRVTIF